MNSRKPSLIVTIDTECDKTANWHTAKPLSFTSVTRAIPGRLQPLFARAGIRPTYFLSPEVMADRESAAVLRSLHNCELATHLHGDYILPKIKTWDFAEEITSDMQWEYPPAIERAKLAALTEMFVQQFDYSPKSFRAGRFGVGPNSGRWLRELGYLVDSSVTPHLCWTSPKGEPKPDFRASPERPYTISPDGDIWSAGNSNFLEVPITILAPGTVPANNPRDPIWFRPWYSDAATLCNVLRHVASQPPENGMHRPLVMMFHNVELVAGASPYPQTEADVQRYLDALERVFALAAKLGIESCTLAEFYQKYSPAASHLERRPRPDSPAYVTSQPISTARLSPEQACKSVLEKGISYCGAGRKLEHIVEAVKAVARQGIPGIFLEAGVALGGSAVVIASAKPDNRPLRLYDLYEMLPAPGQEDEPRAHTVYREFISGERAELIDRTYLQAVRTGLLDTVKENLRVHGLDFSRDQIDFFKGDFHTTLHLTEAVAFAHIDCDWYESVRCCLERIANWMSPGGVIVLDDYKSFSGARKAVDEWLARDSRFRIKAAEDNVIVERLQDTKPASEAPGLALPAEMVEAALERYEVQPWFKHAFRDRVGRWDCWRPCVWVAHNFPKDAAVLSLGTGVGYNLVWLAQHGFTNLHGLDIDARAIAAGKEIAQRANLPMNLWVDDALHPQQLPSEKFSVIEALVWIHLLKDFLLPELLELYVPHLAENGVFIVDMIDAEFNALPNNQYHTQDWEKPVAERRPSEYKTRLSEQQMREIFLSKGLQLAEVIREPQKVPKAVYVARRQSVSKLVSPPSALPASTNHGSKSKDKPLSVCFFAHSAQLAGAERSLLELVRELVSGHGVQCSVVLPGAGPLDQALKRVGATTIQASYPWWCESPGGNAANGTDRLKSGLVTMLRSVLPALKHINADVFVTHSLVVPWGAVAASLLGRPHVWSICEYGERDFRFFLPFETVIKEVAASSEFVFTATEGIRRTLFPQLTDERCRALYRHIPIPSSTSGQTASGTYVCAGAIRLGVFGTLTENKGQEDAVRAMGLLMAAGRNVELVLVGAADPEYRASIEAMIRELGIQERVHLTGFLADPFPLMNEADILMVCTRSEGFGRTAVEGMLLGKPVIYAAAGGFLEYMVDGRTGLSYPCGDYAALANRIALLIDQPGERTRLGAEARAHATAKFSPDAYGGEVFRTIKSIVARQAPPARLSAQLQRLVGSALSEIIDQPDRHEPDRHLAPIATEATMPLEDEFDEKAYLSLHRDVAQAVKQGRCKSGWSHFVSSGFREKRQWFRRGTCNGSVSAIPRTELPEGMDQLQRGWDLLGKVDPLWAILSDPKKKNNGWKTDEFFLSGEGTIASAVQEARRLQPALRLGRALDFGCGVGRLTQALCQHFQEAHGVDIAPSMIEQAKSYNRHGTRCQYHLNSATDLRLFPDHHFDFIYSLIVLQHIRPEFSRQYIREFVRVLALDGVLIFQIPGDQNRYLTGPRSHPELGSADAIFVAEPERLIEMHGLARAEVITLLEQQGATILDIRADSEAGKDAESYTYFATRK